jgi:hypothetical protein
VEQTAQGLVDIISEQGVFLGAGASLLFFFLQVYLDVGRVEARGWADNLKSAALLLGALVTMIFAFYSLHSEYERNTYAGAAESVIVPYYRNCVERVSEFAPEVKNEIVRARLARANPLAADENTSSLLQLECLALAVQRAPPGEDQTTQVGWLMQDVGLGDRLLRTDPNDPTSISATLYEMFGINTDKYLGIGRSLEISGDTPDPRYHEATLSEYWVANDCAIGIEGGACAERAYNVWGWRFSSFEALENQTVRQLLTAVPPEQGENTPEFQQLRTRLQKGENLNSTTPALVRFHLFPQNYYVGTVGRPEALEVFFLSLQDTADLSVREAFLRSGADDPLQLRRRDTPDNRAFIWVYVPTTPSEYRLATWRNLFAYLRGMRVDERVREVADRPTWERFFQRRS